MEQFTGWPTDATAYLAELAADNTREFFAAHRERHEAALRAPTAALAADLTEEFGPLRVLRPQRNLRFRPAAPPYRTDTGAVARTAGGATLAVALSATALTVTAGHHTFDAGQRRRYRAAVDGPPGADLLAHLAAADLVLDTGRSLVGLPRGFGAEHPRIGLLRLRGLLLAVSWPAGEWLAGREPLHRVRTAWRAAAPVLRWLDTHVGPAAPLPPRPRPTGD